jgi:hypothetical protein
VLVNTLIVLSFAQGMSGEFDESFSNARQAMTLAKNSVLRR